MSDGGAGWRKGGTIRPALPTAIDEHMMIKRIVPIPLASRASLRRDLGVSHSPPRHADRGFYVGNSLIARYTQKPGFPEP
jgi:hypothetical protein